MAGTTRQIKVTPELVAEAYGAVASGDMKRIRRYWADDMVWLVPGHNPLSGRYEGLDAFLGFMATVGKLSANSFSMAPIATMTSDDYSADVTHNVGFRGGDRDGMVPFDKLDIDVVHVLRWRDGKVIEGRGAIFGDGTTQYDQFWAPTRADGRRRDTP
jgi:ketosteroid isomerase-like protein